MTTATATATASEAAPAPRPDGGDATALARTVLDRLDETRGRWWLYSMLSSLAAALAASVLLLTLMIGADVLFQLDAAARWVLLSLWCAATLGLLADVFFRSLWRQRTLEGAARCVEEAFPELQSALINLVQLAESPNGAPQAFRQAAIAEAARRARQAPMHRAALHHTRWRRWRRAMQTPRDLAESLAALLAVAGLLALLNACVPAWGSSALRLFTPWRFVPQVGVVRITDVSPGDTTMLVGARLDITAQIEAPPGMAPAATLYVAEEGSRREEARNMLPGRRPGRYAATIASVVRPLTYRLEIGDSQSRIYKVQVVEKPAVDLFEVTYVFPPYLETPPRTVRQRHGDLEAPQYSKARLKIHCASPLSRGYVQLGDQRLFGELSEDRQTLEVELALNEPFSYTVHLFNQAFLGDPNPRVHTVRVIPDKPPEVELVKPPRDAHAAPGYAVALALRASDDYGLGDVRLEWRLADQEDDGVETLHRWESLGGVTAAALTHEWLLPTEQFAAGQELLVRAVAADRRRVAAPDGLLGPQETASPWRRIRLVAPQQAAAERLARRQGVRARLWTILRTQIQARVAAAQLARAGSGAAAQELAQQIRQRQLGVHAATVELAEQLRPETASPEELAWKAPLLALAHGDMAAAVEQAERLAAAAEAPAASVQELMAVQDRIIETLRRLLDEVRRSEAEALAQMPDREGGDLPDDALEKLDGLHEKLQEFLKQQRRVIEASEELAKRPVDDFTEQEEQLLKELAAAEDDWARFMNEAHSDLSRLPEQDFSNPSMLEELVEIQTELEMAADALTKKTTDIAVPLEQLGAEMAEELTHNLEKWLPDTPDRERWSQEEPLSEQMQEAPMAELPGELEDLVGELMEEEEDLFDEMEDMSSSWADSLDAGAGWDAADGPISNMSAKGVTGNRLPNTSEISGRSGEGRQGKAAGEFVGDTAVGKGGRRTPSRLSPDPYVEGQVKDQSTDPVGGATGGGKESGVGGEGLEGPTPAERHRELERMANRQADLRNRAESVDLRLQVLNYHHTDLERLIDLMRAVEQDLRSGRYQSALRRREIVLEGMSNLKTYLEGEFEIRRDATTNLPADVQKEILSSMLEAAPDGWEGLIRQYFESLAVEPEGAKQP